MTTLLQTPPTQRLDHLPTILREIGHSGKSRYDLSTPWRESLRVWATDGVMIAWCSAEDLTPEVFDSVAPWSKRRPRRIPAAVRNGGPWDAMPLELPEIKARRPSCPFCSGRRRSITLRCRHCRATGVMPFTGEPIKVAKRTFIDRWHCSLLVRHGALLYPPAWEQVPDGRGSGSLRFTAGPVTGALNPMTRS